MKETFSFIENGDLDYFRSYLDHIAEEDEDDVDNNGPDNTASHNKVIVSSSSQQPSHNILDSIREDLGTMIQGINFTKEEEYLLEPESIRNHTTFPTQTLSNNMNYHPRYVLKNTFISPFCHKARKHRTCKNDEVKPKQYYTLSSCRKISVAIRVCCATDDDYETHDPWGNNHGICVYPNIHDEEVNEEETGEDEDTPDIVHESKGIIIVNPTSFGKLLPTTVTVEVRVFFLFISFLFLRAINF